MKALLRFLLSPECDLRTGDEFFTCTNLIGAVILVFTLLCITGVLK